MFIFFLFYVESIELNDFLNMRNLLFRFQLNYTFTKTLRCSEVEIIQILNVGYKLLKCFFFL